MLSIKLERNVPLSLYVHLPWCVHKCPYCDFNSHAVTGEFPQQRYVDALLADLEQELGQIWARPIDSIFFGGGTPSLFSAKAIEQLLSGIRARIPLNPEAEITLEANPNTADSERFNAYRNAGVNRLSIGIQSFNDTSLRNLGRVHDAQQAVEAFNLARQAGFKRINIDLMHGLPQQSVKLALADLHQAITLQPEHISWYQLTLEPNTRFYSQPPELPDEEQLEQISAQGLRLLADAGWKRYEVSAYTRPGEQSRHNLNYWRFGDYVGIGAGAHSKVSDVANQRILRRHKFKQPQRYLNARGSFVAHEKAIDTNDLPLEFMLNALRLVEGVETHLFQQHTGLQPMLLEPIMQALQQRQLIVNWPMRIQTSELGLRFLNDTLSHFLPEAIADLPGAQIIPFKLI